MNRVLVVCYSRGGTTRRVAEQLAESLEADLDEIEEADGRSGGFGYVRSALEALAKGLPTIRTRRDPSDYDQVIIGTPVWAGTMASPIRSYLFRHQGRLPRLAFFAVMGGQGAERVLREMQLACGVDDAPTFFTTQHRIERDGAVDGIRDFVRRLRPAGAVSQRVAAA